MTVILTVRTGNERAVRAVESVLSQRLDDMQLLLVDCFGDTAASSLCQRTVEHDIRADRLELDVASKERALDAALEKARGAYVLFMREDDWLGPNLLSHAADHLKAHPVDLAMPAVSRDRMGKDGALLSSAYQPVDVVFNTAEEFRAGLAPFIEGDALIRATGVFLAVDRIRDLGLTFAVAGDAASFMAAYVANLSSAMTLAGPSFHTCAPAQGMGASFEPGLYDAYTREHRVLLKLCQTWGLGEDKDVMTAVHSRYLHRVIECIDNACIAGGRISSIERRQRVQDMIDSPDTREAIRTLRPASREFGVMFAPIARRNAGACFLRARLQDALNRLMGPFAPAASFS